MAPQQSESRELDKVIVRLPDGMRDKLKARAAENNRSMNQEIVARLERTFAHDAKGQLDDIFEKARSGEWPDGVRIQPAKSAPDEKESDVVVAGPWSREVTLSEEFTRQLEDLRRMVESQTETIFQQNDMLKRLLGDGK